METIKYTHFNANTNTETEIELPVGDGAMYGVRNAGPRDHRSQVAAPRPPSRPARPPRMRSIPAGGSHRIPVHRDEDDGQVGVNGDDVIAIPKTWLADSVIVASKAWAAFLQRPDLPEATGDAVTDANNASLHRDALQRHDDNKDKIRFVGELLGGVLGRLVR
jgi:hypothetical protein